MISLLHPVRSIKRLAIAAIAVSVLGGGGLLACAPGDQAGSSTADQGALAAAKAVVCPLYEYASGSKDLSLSTARSVSKAVADHTDDESIDAAAQFINGSRTTAQAALHKFDEVVKPYLCDGAAQ